MSPDDKESEITLGNGSSNRRAKSSPTLISLFEKVVDIVKKYW
jgi:hypothetical protein|tara:strand:+ start:8033 stop:8161 length:129 start_codon:yes stop_codon:yes gene_type:complete